MAATTGRVECMNVGDDFGFVGIRESATEDFEAFIIWFVPSLPTASLRLLHSHWFSMLSRAMSSGDVVTVVHAEDSAIITAVRVNHPVPVGPGRFALEIPELPAKLFP